MANHKSALKRVRQSEKRRIYNRTYRNRTRTYIKQARTMLEDGSDLEAAREATMRAVKDLDMAVSKGILHKNSAARRKSRLMKQLAKLESQS